MKYNGIDFEKKFQIAKFVWECRLKNKNKIVKNN
jgi:hypothetical protein